MNFIIKILINLFDVKFYEKKYNIIKILLKIEI
jgi:hypothetical protein